MSNSDSPRHAASLWYLIGWLLSVYGALILGSGLYQLGHPPQPAVAMEQLHLPVWWGAGLLVIGLGYVVLFRPSRVARRAAKRAEGGSGSDLRQ